MYQLKKKKPSETNQVNIFFRKCFALKDSKRSEKCVDFECVYKISGKLLGSLTRVVYGRQIDSAHLRRNLSKFSIVEMFG